MTKGYVAIDLGAESGRVIVGTLVPREKKVRDNGAHGRVVLEEVHRFTHELLHLPTGLHWNITNLWLEICRGLKKAACWAKQQGGEVDGVGAIQLVSVGVDTWGVDWALVSQSGDLMGLPHAYRDPRNLDACRQVVERLDVDAIYRTTGIQQLPFNTLYSLYAQWTCNRETVQGAEQLLFIPDLLHYWLSGNRVVEATIASTSQMLDCHTGGWSKSLLDPLGIPSHILGPISPPGTQVGRLLPQLARETGLPTELVVVAPASHDTASAIAAVPAQPDRSWCYLSSGTWSLLGAELAEPCVSAEAQAAMFTNELGVEGRIRFLKNIAGLWLVQQCRRDLGRRDLGHRDLQRQGETLSYIQLTQLAAGAAEFRTLIDPDYGPFLSPGDMLDKIRQYARKTGQPEPSTPGEAVRCCLESLALAYRQTLENLEKVLQQRFTHLHIVGGGGQNGLLNQMTADATGKIVCVGPFEATATGNILVQALALGHLDNLDQLRAVVANSFELETYEPASDNRWQEAYQRYLKLVDPK
jgi:rhamnulokinase